MDTISGYVEHIIYQNPENGYTVMELMGEEEAVTCVGNCRGLSEGETIEAKGEYAEHPMYGRQFKIAFYQTTAPKDRVSMERYLGSGAIKGVYEYGCKLFRKRIECAIMMKAAQAEQA